VNSTDHKSRGLEVGTTKKAMDVEAGRECPWYFAIVVRPWDWDVT